MYNIMHSDIVTGSNCSYRLSTRTTLYCQQISEQVSKKVQLQQSANMFAKPRYQHRPKERWRHWHDGVMSDTLTILRPASPTVDSPLLSSISPSLFRSQGKTYIFHKSFSPYSFSAFSCCIRGPWYVTIRYDTVYLSALKSWWDG